MNVYFSLALLKKQHNIMWMENIINVERRMIWEFLFFLLQYLHKRGRLLISRHLFVQQPYTSIAGCPVSHFFRCCRHRHRCRSFVICMWIPRTQCISSSHIILLGNVESHKLCIMIWIFAWNCEVHINEKRMFNFHVVLLFTVLYILIENVFLCFIIFSFLFQIDYILLEEKFMV